MPIVKRKSGNKTKYQARVNYVDAMGNYKTKQSKLFDTKSEAELEETRLRVSLDKTEHKTMTFNELYESYKEHQRDKVRLLTWHKYDDVWKHAEPLLGQVRVDKLTVPTYRSFKEKLLASGLSADRAGRVHKMVKTILKHGNMMYGITSNIPDRVGGFQSDRKKTEMKIMTYDDFRKFIATFDDDPVYRAFFKMLYFEGLRRGEANALRWSDIDFNKKTININKSVSKTKGKYIENPPKTKSSVRLIPLDKEVEQSLLDLHDYFEKVYGFNENWRIFGGPKELGDTSIEKKKNDACKKAGVEQIRIHDFRHSCASYYINLGAPILLVSKLLGHADISMTLNTYSHLYPNEMEEIFRRSEEFKKK